MGEGVRETRSIKPIYDISVPVTKTRDGAIAWTRATEIQTY